MQLGSTPKGCEPWQQGKQDLHDLAIGWLREDRTLRQEHEAAKGRVRGPKSDTRNAKTFFEKFDYAH